MQIESDQSEVTVATKLEDTLYCTKGKCQRRLKLEKLIPTNTSNSIFLI